METILTSFSADSNLQVTSSSKPPPSSSRSNLLFPEQQKGDELLLNDSNWCDTCHRGSHTGHHISGTIKLQKQKEVRKIFHGTMMSGPQRRSLSSQRAFRENYSAVDAKPKNGLNGLRTNSWFWLPSNSHAGGLSDGIVQEQEEERGGGTDNPAGFLCGKCSSENGKA